MGSQHSIRLENPIGGLDRRLSYRQQPPYTTPSCLNVRPRAQEEKRERLGSRPGITRSHSDTLGSGNPVRMLDQVTVVGEDGFRVYEDEFLGGGLSDSWAALASFDDDLPQILPDNLDDVTADANSKAGTVLSSLPIDSSQAYTVEIYISPYEQKHWGTYSLIVQMDNSTPAHSTDGLVLTFSSTTNDGDFSATLKRYASGVQTNSYSTDKATLGVTDSIAVDGWLSLEVVGTAVRAYWHGVQLFSQTLTALSGLRVGFGMECTVDTGLCLVDAFRAQYYIANAVAERRTMLVASAGGSLYRETVRGSMEQVSSTHSFLSDRTIHSAERTQKLYIADDGPRLDTGTSATVAVVDGKSRLTVNGTAGSVNAQTHVIVTTNVTGTVLEGTWLANTAIDGNTIELTENIGAGTCTFYIDRAPKIYDPIVNAVSIWRTEQYSDGAYKGQVPTGCNLVALYRDRLVLVGDLWYMSRQANPLDFDYFPAENDFGRAVAGQSSLAGELGALPTAVIPHSDDYLLFGTAHELWVMKGDPAWGGTLDNLSRDVGVVSGSAWCYGPSGETIFLSHKGLYLLPSGNSRPESISWEKLPNDLQNIDTDRVTVSMAYDSQFRGVHIFLSHEVAEDTVHYWLDWATGSFWEAKYKSAHEPFCLLPYYSESTFDRAVVMGCRDGNLRRHRDKTVVDSGQRFESRLMYGPLKLGGNDHNDGILLSLNGVLAENSNSVSWKIYSGQSHEKTVKSTAKRTGTFYRGSNKTARPRVRGASLAVELSSPGGRHWAVDTLYGIVENLGRTRKQ